MIIFATSVKNQAILHVSNLNLFCFIFYLFLNLINFKGECPQNTNGSGENSGRSERRQTSGNHSSPRNSYRNSGGGDRNDRNVNSPISRCYRCNKNGHFARGTLYS